MLIERLINPLFSSNTYIIDTNLKEVIIIDPGDTDVQPLVSWLKSNYKIPNYVILTHEHLDHIAGVTSLSKLYNFQLLTSESCSKNISDTRKNFSKYHETVDDFKITLPAVIIQENEVQHLNGVNLKFILTPGHSEGSICIFMANIAFTGDTIMEMKTPLNLPGSNKNDYTISLKKIHSLLGNNTIIYPGHGEAFQFNLNKI